MYSNGNSGTILPELKRKSLRVGKLLTSGAAQRRRGIQERREGKHAPLAGVTVRHMKDKQPHGREDSL